MSTATTFKFTARVNFSGKHSLGTKFYEVVSVTNNETGNTYVLGIYGPVGKRAAAGKISGGATRKVYGLEKTVDQLIREKQKSGYQSDREAWIVADANSESEMLVMLKRHGLELSTPSEQKGMGLTNPGGVSAILSSMAKVNDPAYEKELVKSRSAIATSISENPFAGTW
ncbi:hypothetical protein ATN89_17335 [Comamonas thiooxydans]|uniref:hypothetical protein n=1 Tax=Comamonas thiooxydans TaxID=363952 RepID=UPI0007C4737C|nr:hypothetical protein [Comamonas thiooxydans]OAD82847.1 hypothetical protein ATN89_17335 [Comamonas thiooxydans]